MQASLTVPETNVQSIPYQVSSLGNIPIASLTYQQVLDHLEMQIRQQCKTFCVTLNLDILRLTHKNSAFLNVVKNADFVFADGMPIIWLSKLLRKKTQENVSLPERVPGCDIVQDLCRLSHEKGYRIFMLGAGPGVAEIAKEKLEQKLPDIKIVGTYCPSAQELQNEESSQTIIRQINASQADILFVALGAPKQENWIFNNREAINSYVIIPCGGSIDFIAGAQKKSPQWVGKLGLEWLFRMAFDPHRLFKRYILNDLPFLVKMMLQSKSTEMMLPNT